MKAFISYSHSDRQMLDILHKHLAQLQRENLISTWTDREIVPGASIQSNIQHALENSKFFLALLSPDYIASQYCYEKEFTWASELQEKGQLLIIPIILEPCDWLNTPFSKFKALPNDGKAISTWDNKNTAFLDVIQNIRKLIGITKSNKVGNINNKSIIETSTLRNYRVQKDFDSIEKLEFLERTFKDIKLYLKRFINEIIRLDNIKVRILSDNEKEFKCLLVNRNKVATESELNISNQSKNPNSGFFQLQERTIEYTLILSNKNQRSARFNLSFDQYHLFWTQNGGYFSSSGFKELSSQDIAEVIWNELLQSVGIL